MSSALTTAMLALPNDSLGRGVIACYPLEDAAGSTTAVDVANASNAATNMNWRGVWASTNSYNPRDLVVINTVGTSQVAWYCVAPIPTGGSAPGTDVNNWVKLFSTSYAYRGVAATPITAAINDAYVDPTNGKVYRCSTAVTSSNVYPNADATHWSLVNSALVTGGKTLTIAGTGSVLTAGGTAVVTGAVSSFGSTSANPITALFSHAAVVGDIAYGMGNAVSFFAVVNITSASFTAANGVLFEIGSAFRCRITSSQTVYLAVGAAYGNGVSAAGSVQSEEGLTVGMHSIEGSFDGKSCSLVIDGNLAGYQYVGANGFNNSVAVISPGYPIQLLADGSLTGAVCQMNNALVMNRCLTRAEHRALAVAAGITLNSSLPARNRGQDAYNSAVASAGLGAACATCGGTMASNEASVTNGNLRYHPNCQINTLQIPISSTTTVSQGSAWAQQQMLSYCEILSTGLSQNFGTRFLVGSDTWGTASSTAYFWRGSISGGAGVALAAHAVNYQPNHWMWSIVRGQMELALNFTVGSSQGGFGLAPDYSLTLSDDGAPTITSPSEVLNVANWGNIRPGITPDGSTLNDGDNGASIFVGGDMAMMALAMKPYLQKSEPTTWARWVYGVEAVAWYNYAGYTSSTPAPGYLYNVNGNWNVNRLKAIYGAYRVTGDPAWLTRYHNVMAFAINPWCTTQINGTLITSLVPTTNGLGNYNPRGMWSPGNNYAVADEVGVIIFDGLSPNPNWRGDWSSGGAYALNDMVYDRSNGDLGYYRAKAAVSGSSTAPSSDTTNWQAGYPQNYSVWIVANAVTNSTVRPDLDTTGSFIMVAAGNSTNNGGMAGLIGTVGSDTTNWSDYKTTFTEWQGNIYNTVAGPPGALRGLPGYDGDYHGNIQSDALLMIFLMMGGPSGPNPQTSQSDWLQMKQLLNGHINMMLPFINQTTMVDTCTYGSPSYCCRHNLSEGFSGGIIAMAIANGRSDLATAGWNVGQMIKALSATTQFQILGGGAASNYATMFLQLGVLAHIDPKLVTF